MHARLLLLSLLLTTSRSAAAQFGDLAPEAALNWQLGGVKAEVGVVFAIDPSYLSGRLPRGFRVSTLARLASRGDTTVRAILSARPELAQYVITVLAVARMDTLHIEGDSSPAQATQTALWWVPAQLTDTTSPLPDVRAKRGEQWVELAFWSAEPHFARRLGEVMPATAPAAINMQWESSDSTWGVRLVIPSATIVGECKLRGASAAANYPLPQYSTVWNGDNVPGAFAVYTYYGHRSQACSGAWQASGNGTLARALRTGVVIDAANQTGWSARAAAYLPAHSRAHVR